MEIENENKQYVISILVENNAGVLRRVSNLFARRCYNIDSLSVGRTENPDKSRITVVTFTNKQLVLQIKKQLEKLVEILDVEILSKSQSVYRELVFIKIETNEHNRGEIIELSKIFRARIVDVAGNSMIFEITGDSGKVEAAINALAEYKILEMTRTGLTAIRRGSK